MYPFPPDLAPEAPFPLLFPSPRSGTGVKICGLRSAAQAAAAVEAGADAIGVNLWPRSKRYLALEEAAPWLRELAGATRRVAVTVNAEDDELRRCHESGVFDLIQLHGDETPERVRRLLEQGLPVFKALGVRDRTSIAGLAGWPGATLLLDAYVPGEYGGGGEPMDWALGAEAVAALPGREIVLAGGLAPQNVAAAVRQVGPAGVDVASGVESAPGVKDPALVRAFCGAVAEASR